jgi:hypothetical protein
MAAVSGSTITVRASWQDTPAMSAKAVVMTPFRTAEVQAVERSLSVRRVSSPTNREGRSEDRHGGHERAERPAVRHGADLDHGGEQLGELPVRGVGEQRLPTRGEQGYGKQRTRLRAAWRVPYEVGGGPDQHIIVPPPRPDQITPGSGRHLRHTAPEGSDFWAPDEPGGVDYVWP